MAGLSAQVLVVGAGISGAACAQALRSAGVTVAVRERGRAPGGRMAAPSLHGRRVDLGAGYFTVKDDAFAEVAGGWAARGLAREWTDTFDVLSAGERSARSGPVRWAAPDGLRSLVRDLLSGVDVELGDELTSLDGATAAHDAVVLAMPDPQAARLVPGLSGGVDFEPVIAVATGYTARCWPLEHAAFVNDDPDITFLADDGSRRGDAAPVLVAHTSAQRAGRHLADPDAAVAPVLAALRRLGVDGEPLWTHAHRWTFAKPAGTHDEPFALTATGSGLLGRCGDAWCPEGSPRVESAWLSGQRLGSELAHRLARAAG